MQYKEQRPLSLIDILTRNLLLLTIMFVAIGLGIAVHLLDKYTLDCHFLQIQSKRLGFIFFIIVAACYVSLLFIFIKKQWVNFFVQLFVSFILFVVLIFVFNPRLTVSLYFPKFHGEFSTRSWAKVDDLPVSDMASFGWLQMPDKEEKYFSSGIICPVSYSHYLFNFVFTRYYELPSKAYKKNKIKTGLACNKAALKLIKQTPSREKALLSGDYEYFLQLDSNMNSTRFRQAPLAIPMAALPIDLQKKLKKYAELQGEPFSQEMITPIVLRNILESKKINLKKKHHRA